ncbi:MAG: succinate dehydrogenase, hydrophobic membrane anchor protein [Pseudomonadota bacterium]
MKGGTPLGRVLGHGSARGGAQHWWVQRVTAVALIPLIAWFVWSLLRLPGFDHGSVTAWIGGPWHAVLLLLLFVTACWHSRLGVQVVIEDYVHTPATKIATLLVADFSHVLIAVAGAFAILKIAFAAP